MSRIESEKRVVAKMIAIYNRHHQTNADELLTYAHQRLDRCPHGEAKPTCRKCPIHCYRPDMRQLMKEVMRYSGPRMILYSPLDAIRHILRELL